MWLTAMLASALSRPTLVLTWVCEGGGGLGGGEGGGEGGGGEGGGEGEGEGGGGEGIVTRASDLHVDTHCCA